MKKIFLLFATLCVSHITFSQINVDYTTGNVGIGAMPSLKAKLLLYYKSAATDSIFGLYSTVGKATNNSSTPIVYGAYLKNEQTSPSMESGSLYGIHLDNKNTAYSSSTYGVYAKNSGNGYSSSMYGFYSENKPNNAYSTLYGLYADNTTTTSSGGNLYGVYLNNNKQTNATFAGNMYGIYSTNNYTNGVISSNGLIYGAYLSASSNTTNTVYGIYSTVSGGAPDKRYSGYFTGGKFVVMNGNVGIGRENPAYLLDVNGTIRVSSTLYSSDERLKSDIKPLTDEKDKLYLLQGKSYKKAPLPSDMKDSLSLAEKAKRKEEIIATPEYGYLAQELKEVFPDLVSQDSAGYYAVNYIGLIPVIVEALKGQRSEDEKKQILIEKLLIENEKQQDQIDEQREQIKQLVKLMGIKSIDKKAFEENGIESIPLLLQNTPNPFNQTTEIGYFIPETVGSANIYIYDVNGVQQRNIYIAERGNGVTVLQATALQAGIYFYTLICDGKPVDTKQMILTR